MKNSGSETTSADDPEQASSLSEDVGPAVSDRLGLSPVKPFKHYVPAFFVNVVVERLNSVTESVVWLAWRSYVPDCRKPSR